MILNEYQRIIREHFDISDTYTRKTIIALEDSQQNQLLNSLANALYEKVVGKVDKIDFGTIPKSRGDITKVEGFDNTVECLNIIRNMVVEYKEDTGIVDTVLSTINYIKQMKTTFMKCFSLNINFGITLYNLIVMTIEQSVSFLIAVTIQYIKDPSTQSVESALDKAAYNNTKDNMLYQQLVNFNKACASGEVDQILRDIIKNGGKITEGLDVSGIDNPETGVNTININVGGGGQAGSNVKIKKPGAQNTVSYEDNSDDNDDINNQEDPEECEPTPTMAINGGTDATVPGSDFDIEQPVEEIGVGTLVAAGVAVAPLVVKYTYKGVKLLIGYLIPMMRNITYFVLNSVVSFSDSLAVQAQLIEMNAYKLQYSTTSDLSDDKKKKVVEKQLKIAAKLKSISSKFAIDQKKAKKEAEKMVEEDKKNKKKISEDPDNSDDISAGDLF